VATHNLGFDIIDITDPAEPSTVGRYATPGANYHSWISINPTRKLAAYSIESPGVAVSHGGSNGVEFVDISDVTAPTLLGEVSGLGSGGAPGNGPHTIRWIDARYLYTTLPTHILDVADPADPKDLDTVTVGGRPLCGHEFYPDPNIPHRTYVGFCAGPGAPKWGILDTTDPAKPTLISQVQDNDIVNGHEVYPSPDGSFVGVTDYRVGPATGYTYLQCPGGGIHFYDISGRYISGASLTDPKKMGVWFAPFKTLNPQADGSSTNPNWGSCTTHSWQMQLERDIFAAGLYTAGSWVGDPTAATKKSGGLYTEWGGTPGRGLGPTTWGNTTGNFFAEGDFVNASQWLPFDVPSDPDAGKYLFTNGLVRGFDILKYTGPLPKKLARLTVSAAAPGGVVSGVLDRYAVLTYLGWQNKPLAGMTLEVSSGGVTRTVTTGDDGSFSANLGLAAGSHPVTVSWAGDDTFQVTSVTQNVQS
jgi:hypothetical protein